MTTLYRPSLKNQFASKPSLLSISSKNFHIKHKNYSSSKQLTLSKNIESSKCLG